MGTLSGVMDSMIASSAKDRGFDPQKTLKLVFSASPFSTQDLEVRAKTGRPRIICLGKVTRLHADLLS